MTSFILFQVTSATAQMPYAHEVMDWVRTNIPDMVCLDVDNRSESFLYEEVIRIIVDSDRTILWIEIYDETEANRILPVFEKLLRRKEKIKVVLKGKHRFLEVLLNRPDIDCHQYTIDADNKNIFDDTFVNYI